MSNASADPADLSSRPTRYRYVVLAALCLAASLAYIPRNSISAAESTIRADLELTKKDTRWIITGFFLTYALCQIPSGQAGHRWGTRRSLTLFSAINSLGTGLFALAPGMGTLIAGRMGMGVAQAGYFPCSAMTIGKWIPKRQQALASGMLGSFMSVGGFIGVALTGLLLVHVGWRTIYLLFAIPGLLWAVWFYWMFRDRPEEHAAVNREELASIREDRLDRVSSETPRSAEDESDDAESAATPWLALGASPALWLICAQQFCRAAGYIFYASWFATFLQESRGVSIAESGVLNSLPLLATILGGPSGGRISDWLLVKTGSPRIARQGVATAAMLACAGLIFVAYGVQSPRIAVLLISAGAYCAAYGGPISYTITIDMGGRYVAPVFGTMNMVGNLGALAFPVVVPEILDWTGKNWNAVMLLFAGLYVAAAAFWLLLNPRGTVLQQSFLRSEGGA